MCHDETHKKVKKMSHKKLAVVYNPKQLYGFANHEHMFSKRNSYCEVFCTKNKIKNFSLAIDRTLFQNKRYKSFVLEYKKVFLELTNLNKITTCQISRVKLTKSDIYSPMYPIVQPTVPIFVLFANKIPVSEVISKKWYYVTAQSLQFDRYISFVE